MSKLVLHSSLDHFDALVASGVPENQAKIHIKVIDKSMSHFAGHHLASKDDIQNIKGDMTSLRSEIGAVEVKLNAEIKSVSGEVTILKNEVSCLKDSLNEFKQFVTNQFNYQLRLFCRVAGALVLGIGTLLIREFSR